MTLLATLDTMLVVSRCWSCGEPQQREVQVRHAHEGRFWHCSRCAVSWQATGEPLRG